MIVLKEITTILEWNQGKKESEVHRFLVAKFRPCLLARCLRPTAPGLVKLVAGGLPLAEARSFTGRSLVPKRPAAHFLANNSEA